MALLKPEGLLGIHTNMPATVPPDVSKALATGGPEPSGLSADEKKAYEVLDHFYATGTGYAGEMGNRPQTLYGIADSPVGLAAWMIDHDVRSYELIARAFDGDAGGLGGLGVAGDSVAEETASQRPPEPFRGNRQQIGRLFTRLGGITGTALARIRPPSARGCPGVLAAGRRDHVRAVRHREQRRHRARLRLSRGCAPPLW